MERIVSVDLGSYKLRMALVSTGNRSIRIVHEALTDPKYVLRQICAVLNKLPKFEGIGVAAPGILSGSRGIIHYAPYLKIRNLKIVSILEKRYKVPVFLWNNAEANVLGEKLFGAGRGFKNIVSLAFSSGIGCGVITENRILLGKDGNAHEVGHCVIDADSRMKCGCGRYGHWEAYCGGAGIPKFAGFLLRTKYKDKKSVLHKYDELTPKLVFDSAKKDGVALKIVNDIGRLNAIGVANVIDIYDPELITISGSVALNHKTAIMRPILSNVKKYAINRLPRIVITPLEGKAVLYGAVSDFI